MSYSSFVEKAILQDKRNAFTKFNGDITFVPDGLKEFYRLYNPADVEVNGDGNSIHFYPAEELCALQVEYAYINALFVFASCNGDPIFVDVDRKVYTCPHGVKAPKKELLANSFESFLDASI